MLVDLIKPATNEAGLVTLRERPWPYCVKHDSTVDLSFSIPICEHCYAEQRIFAERKAQEQRIYEIRQAVREYFEQAGKAAL